MSGIRIKPEEIEVDKAGKVIINNKELAEVFRKKLSGTEGDVEGQERKGFFDWGCTNIGC